MTKAEFIDRVRYIAWIGRFAVRDPRQAEIASFDSELGRLVMAQNDATAALVDYCKARVAEMNGAGDGRK